MFWEKPAEKGLQIVIFQNNRPIEHVYLNSSIHHFRIPKDYYVVSIGYSPVDDNKIYLHTKISKEKEEEDRNWALEFTGSLIC